MTREQRENTRGEADDEVEQSILAYLHSHPQAADTLRGITNWWLPQQRYEREYQRIERTVGSLVASGKLSCSQLPGGEAIYSLCKHTPQPSRRP